MDPFFARNRLSAYLDGTLPDAEAAEVADALERDPDLRTEYDAMRSAVDLLRHLGPVEAPSGFHARVMESVAAEPAPGGVVSWLRRSFTRVPVEALALAAAAVVVVVVIQGRTGANDLAGTSPEPGDKAAAEQTSSAGARGTRSATSADPAGPSDLPGLPEADLPAANAAPELATVPADSVIRQVKDAPKSEPTRDKLTSEGVGTSSLGVKTPDEPWYPDWQKPDGTADTAQQATSSDKAMAKPFAYRITLADSQVLYDLSAFAEQAGGRLVDSAGRPLRAHALTPEETYVMVQLVVEPAFTDVVKGKLQKIGATETSPPASAPLVGSDRTLFIVEVSYQP